MTGREQHRVRLKCKTHFIIFVFGIFWLSLAAGSRAGYGGRPLATEDAGVAPHGKAQIETSFDNGWEGSGDQSYTFLITPIYGLLDRVEFSAELPFLINNPEEEERKGGLADIGLVFKGLAVPEGKIMPALLLKSFVKLANGSENKGLGSGDEDVGLVTVLTKNINALTLHANIGYVFVGSEKDDSLKDYIIYGFAGEYALTQKLKAVGEWYAETNSHFDSAAFQHHDAFNPLVGLTYQLSRWATLDTAFRFHIAREKEPEYGFSVGATLNM